jgi:hypothetical protein
MNGAYTPFGNRINRNGAFGGKDLSDNTINKTLAANATLEGVLDKIELNEGYKRSLSLLIIHL